MANDAGVDEETTEQLDALVEGSEALLTQEEEEYLVGVKEMVEQEATSFGENVLSIRQNRLE